MFSTDDTIVAIATPPGRGGIGVLRISGARAQAVVQRLVTHTAPFEPRRATLTLIRGDDAEKGPIDHAVVTYFSAPASYTGEDVVELSVHGSPVVLNALIAAAGRCGARLAAPGEFTLRAYLNGRMDLIQAEAVADLVDAVTPLQAKAAFDQLQGTLTETIGRLDAALFDLMARLEASVDFPEEGYHFADPAALRGALDGLIQETDRLLATARRGRLVREGFQVAVVGAPNVGKSSLFNALVGSARAIVTPVAGTTRDLVTETVNLEGFQVTLIDTAGLRETNDVVEAEGVARTRRAADVADVTLLVLDASRPAEHLAPPAPRSRRIAVQNKIDLGATWTLPGAVRTSAVTGAGLDELRTGILAALDVDLLDDRPAVTNIRHAGLLEDARAAMVRARDAVSADDRLPEEFVLADLQGARSALEEVAGKRAPGDLLAHIFARFCIGK